MFNSGPSALGFGSNCSIVNNTFIGTRSFDTIEFHPERTYGFSFLPQFFSNNVEVKNNLFVGIATCNLSVGCQNNIVYYGEFFENDSEGVNKNNFLYYNGESYNNQPYVFDGSGSFFVGGEGFDELEFNRTHANLNSYFVPVIGSDACSGGVITHGHLAGQSCANVLI